MNEPKDWVLITWIIAAFVWDVLVFSAAGYMVFYHDQSGWWFVAAVIVTMQTTLFKVLSKRYGLPLE